MMSKETRSISLPARPVLAGRKEHVGTKAGVGSLKENRSKRGSEKEKEIEARALKFSALYLLIFKIFHPWFIAIHLCFN